MNLGKYIFGIREEYILRLEQQEREEQFLAYNLLTAMFLVLVLLIFVSTVCYGLIIFQSWLPSIIMALFFSVILFVLLLLVLFLNMKSNVQQLTEKMTDFDEYYESIKEPRFINFNDDEALEYSIEHERILRSSSEKDGQPSFHISHLFITTIKVFLVILISFIVANGMEMLLFHNKLNETLHVVRESNQIKSVISDTTSAVLYRNENQIAANWTLNMLTEKPENPFILIDSYSFLLSFEILNLCLGKWKIVFDLSFSILFLIPFFLVKKSSRYAGGGYLRELTFSHLSTTLLFRILTDRKAASIHKELQEIDYELIFKKDKL
jgi:hypothetical protein